MNNSDPLIKNIKQTLELEKLDSDIAEKLTQARHKALHQQQPKTSKSFRYFKPALAFAGVATLAVIISLLIAPEEANTSMDIFESMDIITSRDDLEMYENLEFYLWLEEQIKT